MLVKYAVTVYVIYKVGGAHIRVGGAIKRKRGDPEASQTFARFL